jgi:hypothetical protein
MMQADDGVFINFAVTGTATATFELSLSISQNFIGTGLSATTGGMGIYPPLLGLGVCEGTFYVTNHCISYV